MTVMILIGSLPKLVKQTGVSVNYSDFQIETIMKFIVEMTSQYNRVFESASRYPDVCFVLLTKMFSYAIMDNQKELKFKHIWQAISTTEVVYPDVLKKFIVKFKETLDKELEKEMVDLSN